MGHPQLGKDKEFGGHDATTTNSPEDECRLRKKEAADLEIIKKSRGKKTPKLPIEIAE